MVDVFAGASSSSVCSSCLPGKFSSTIGMSFVRRMIPACYQRLMQSGSGANSSNTCKYCMPGFYSNASGRIPHGHFSVVLAQLWNQISTQFMIYLQPLSESMRGGNICTFGCFRGFET